jgi:hypothetical protein
MYYEDANFEVVGGGIENCPLFYTQEGSARKTVLALESPFADPSETGQLDFTSRQSQTFCCSHIRDPKLWRSCIASKRTLALNSSCVPVPYLSQCPDTSPHPTACRRPFCWLPHLL